MSTYEDFEDDTVTLTFDDDKKRRTVRFTFTVIPKMQMVNRPLTTSRMMRNMKLHQMLLMSYLIQKNLMKFLMMMTRSNPRHLYYCSGTTAKNTMSSVPLLIIE